ncbi:lipopolysaccharide assembly protein LapB [Acidisphaera sp. S103]|uniref:tetratricopeptide repeat protein n=1 Tax=Acidisphaera sp. S103 TaxID=1747223 RepID=UPI00131D63C4|nr:tetratricopeptide repeat protein [Acidisphaera sp. S103]
MTEALAALEIDDVRRAAEIWAEAVERYPNQTLDSHLAVNVLLGLRRFDEADALMQEGLRKSPNDQRCAIGLAHVARVRGDHESAAERWAKVRKQFPNVMDGYAFGVMALRGLNRLPDAEALTRQTMARFPDEVLGFMEYGRLADIQQDWDQALERWTVVLTRFDHLSGYTGAAQAMVKLGRYDEADALLARARVRYPIDPSVGIGLAISAQTKGDIPEAISRWKYMVQHFPMHIVAVFNAAGALDKLGATDDAEQVLRDAVDHFPREPRPMAELGMLLLRRRDFSGAAKAFATLRDVFPNNKEAYLRGAEALDQAGQLEEAELLRKDYRNRFGG